MTEKIELLVRDKVHVFSNDDMKESVIKKLGKPDDAGGFFGKRKIPLTQKHSGIEFHNEPDGKLRLIYKRRRNDIPFICIPFYDENT
ncbi:hypothetical protein [Gynuella sunshinyii]|uniref:Uncharacterized protein n=1 Tax=Gynuella sunshinyii YC6258 TaxID=1445510 RepID=A0A0C5VWP6_9GAMM|nr:hypothetical protein [Gynuella sunshinyii]AJQ94859.1 hypothetical Protein YC6258_02821 [Gynuella sunshinyii YC6258]